MFHFSMFEVSGVEHFRTQKKIQVVKNPQQELSSALLARPTIMMCERPISAALTRV